uniref:F-box domain-containing protein n=1 Tax=Triticum aestivum TaxID=4565 RepID=A0A077S3M4_WHEAT|nr:unnamed protein product [Triticum aestivum]
MEPLQPLATPSAAHPPRASSVPTPVAAPDPRLPPPAIATDAVVAEMVAATHIGQKRRWAGTHVVPSKLPVPAPAAKAAKPAGKAAKPAKPTTSTAAAPKRKEKQLASRKRGGGVEHTAALPPPPPSKAAPAPPTATDVFDEMSAPSVSYRALLDDAEVNIGSPPLASFDFHVEEPAGEEEEDEDVTEIGEEVFEAGEGRCLPAAAAPLRRRTALPDNEDLLQEILLRLPPRPSSLPRASLVCKSWRSLVTDPQFQRRFRDHHGKPPLLGFFLHEHRSCSFIPMLDRPDRIPGTRFSISLDDGHIIDCRHGLVLFLGQRRLLVWDPVAREQRRLIPPPELDSDQMSIFNGGVLRPAGGQGCRSSHFQVALMAGDRERERVSAYLYSETGIWGNISSLQLQWQNRMGTGTSTLTGNSLCWLIQRNHQCVILEFDLDRQSLTLRELPPHVDAGYHNLSIMPAEDGGLG